MVTDICLINMPFSSLHRPSMGLGLLAAVLERDGFSATVRYANLEFAARNARARSELFTDTPPQDCLGDWIFVPAAFPNKSLDEDTYLDFISHKYGFAGTYRQSVRDILLELREEASRFINDLASEIATLKPRITGCTSTFQQHVASLALLRRLREIAPEVITMMGGANCETTMGLATHRCFDWIDYVISGEADGFISELCQLVITFERNIPAEKLPLGVFAAVHSTGSPVTEGEAPRALTRTMQGLPAPTFDSYFETLQRMPFREEIHPRLPMETSRGCWWGQKNHCTFCGLNGRGIVFRSRPAPEVLEELRMLSERYGQTRFEMVDNILDQNYFRSLLPELAAQKRPYQFFYEVKSNLTRDQAVLLRQAGVTWIQPGIESLHSEVLRLINKGVRAVTNVQLLKWARELGIRLSWNMLYKVPLEKDEWYLEMAEWLPWICHLQPPLTFNAVRIDRYSPYHQSPALYGLKLHPARIYRHIYPVSNDDLAHLAYFFDYEEDPPREGQDENPGTHAVSCWIRKWHELFQRETPLLQMTDDGSKVRILDTRPCAAEREFWLEGLDRQILLLCDEAPVSASLQQRLRKTGAAEISLQEITARVVELKQRKILLELDGNLISLPLRGDFLPFADHENYRQQHWISLGPGEEVPEATVPG